MSTILVPIDGSECSLQALREAIRQAKDASTLTVQLLNVQPRIFPEEALIYLPAAIYLPADKIDTYYYEQGSRALAPAEAELRKAGVAFASHRAVGPVEPRIGFLAAGHAPGFAGRLRAAGAWLVIDGARLLALCGARP